MFSAFLLSVCTDYASRSKVESGWQETHRSTKMEAAYQEKVN